MAEDEGTVERNDQPPLRYFGIQTVLRKASHRFGSGEGAALSAKKGAASYFVDCALDVGL